MIRKNILIATGGTGGHIFPAFSLANYLKEKNYTIKLTSDKRGLRFLNNTKSFETVNMPSSPLIKKNYFAFLYSIFTIFFATVKSFIYLLFNRPSIVFGMGGYSSFPICFAAFILKIKFVIYENNLILGKANKFLLPFAKKIFVSYQDLEGIPVKYKNKVVTIGNLVREEIDKYLQDADITPSYLLGEMKDIIDKRETSDRDKLSALNTLIKISGMLDTDKKTESLAVFQGFTREQLGAVQEQRYKELPEGKEDIED